MSWFSDLADMTMTPNTNIICFWRHHDTPNNSRKNHNLFCFSKIRFLEVSKVWTSGTLNISEKTGAERSRSSVYFWKSWILDQYVPEDIEWIVGNMASISIEKGEMKFLIFETLQPLLCATRFLSLVPRAHFAILKLWNSKNYETWKLRNFETLKRRNEETKKPRHF